MGPQGVFARRLGRPLGVVDVEDDVALAHVKVPGDDRGGVDDLDQNLERRGRREDQVRKGKWRYGREIKARK